MVTLSQEARTAYVPVGTARKMLNVSRQRIYQLLTDGKLNGYQQDGTWLVRLISIHSRIAYLKNQGG
jgi:hypothetical protein